MRDWVDFALRLADAARAETLPRWRSAIAVDDKGGAGAFDPVTDADREAERAMRDLIGREHPEHGVRGEEFGDRRGEGPWCWSLDPVDGTRAFTCGLPTWVTLIALLKDGAPEIGIVDAPCLGERYVGTGAEAWIETDDARRPVAASGCSALREARLSTTDPFLFAGAAAEAFGRLRGLCRTARYGLDGYAYARLADGTLDLVVETGLKPHDYHALIPLVRGAGGTIGDWRGGEDFAVGSVIAAASRGLYEAAVEVMRGA